jgi:hypothetical protein
LPSYRIRRTEEFDRDVSDHLANHYPAGKKGRAARRDFAGLLGPLLKGLLTDPRRHGKEPWPGDAPPGWELRKAYFDIPRLKFPARLGRLVYLVHHEACEVVPVWFYTHAEFTGRPSDAALGARVSDALRPEADD